MAAKLLHSLADDNPDLQKQIGCMTGFFQIFDRQHVLTGRRLTQRRLPPPPLPGDSSFNGGSSGRESFNTYYQNSAAEKNFSRSVNEKQRLSVESSRASFSSSCSSMSSQDFNRSSQQEVSSLDRIIFPETPQTDPGMNHQPSTSSHFGRGRQSLDLRDVVKESMYREMRVKNATKEEAPGQAIKHKDSPRPLQLSKYEHESYEVYNKGKQNNSADLKESLKVLAKLREAPWYYNENREQSVSSSYDAKDRPRFSYDGRETNRLSFESRDTIRSATKLKQLPRLSLDGREISLWSSNSDTKSDYVSKDFQISIKSDELVYGSQQSSQQKRPPSVVAKLMGLEALPDSFPSTSYTLSGSTKASTLKINEPNRSIRIPKSPRTSAKESCSPRWKTPDIAMKPISKFPIEPAPWKQPDGHRFSQKPKPAKAAVKGPTTNAFPSVYSEIEKRLKDIEFKQSGKDLRALKQILEAIQAKGILETNEEEKDFNLGISSVNYDPKSTTPNRKPRVGNQQSIQGNGSTSVTQNLDSLKTYESPIVIMRPAKKESVGNQTAKNQSSGNINTDSASKSGDKKSSVRNTKSAQSRARPQQFPKENNSSSIKNSGSVSPRLQQRKLELERRVRPPTPPSDPSKSRRQSNRQPTESGSPGGRKRLIRAPKTPQSDDQLSQVSNESRNSSHQGDDLSQLSDGTVIFNSKTDVEVSSAEPRCCDSPMPNQNIGDEGMALEELDVVAAAAPEHPSPVSVLDALIYRDDDLSPVKQTPNAEGNSTGQDCTDRTNEDARQLTYQPRGNQFDDNNYSSYSTGSGLNLEINRKKLQSIENLVQKLQRLNSTHDEASTDYIASLCENTNPDHRYISEILLASGLLLRDLGSGLATFQLHQSGYPINPELFYVLEQTKHGYSLSIEDECSKAKKYHRKLIFDTVNEILTKKLANLMSSELPKLKSDIKLVKKSISAQKLLKELCSDIEQLQFTKAEGGFEEDEEVDVVRCILIDDVMRCSEIEVGWNEHCFEVSDVVLDVERLIFKDLVNEIVLGESTGLNKKPVRRRQLFPSK